MKVLLVNTSEKTGGAAIAANRLMKALNNNGVEASLLVRDKQTESPFVSALSQSLTLKAKFVWERVVIWFANGLKRRNLFQVDIANTGTDITKLPEFKEADIIHLHWINQGFLSLENIQSIIKSEKPVVWTLHDMWPFTGICHYSGECDKFLTECRACPMLTGGCPDYITTNVFRQKQQILQKSNITFVTCSKWLGSLAVKSKLLSAQKVISIPNTIDCQTFRPMNKDVARSQNNLPTGMKLLLFSSQKTTDPRKGFKYLVEACRIIKEQNSSLAQRIGVIVVGGQADLLRKELPFPIYAIDYISNEEDMARLYNSADAYITPSLEDNLPNTIVEAMSCGLPCVGFKVGGIPEMIDHKQNGYLVETRNADDLAQGICYILDSDNYASFSHHALNKALATYGESVVASKYIEVYKSFSNS